MNIQSPRKLKVMLTEAKDTSEVMLDLAYAALYYGDSELADEVIEAEDELNRLVYSMREVCLLASRSPSDAAGLASLLQVIGAIEIIGNQAVDIAKIVLEEIGIPAELRGDLVQADEVVDRFTVAESSGMDRRTVEEVELSVYGARLLAMRRGSSWMFDPADQEVLSPGDVLVVRCLEEKVDDVRRLAGASLKPRPPDESGLPLSDLDRAVDAVVEMKDLSEATVGLAYAALLFRDRALASEVNRMEDRLDDMRESLESWVLDAAPEARVRPSLRGLLHLAVAAESIGDAAQAMVWLIDREEELHPVISDSLGVAEEVVIRITVGDSSEWVDQTLEESQLHEATGMTVLAVRKEGRWRYRPTGRSRLRAGDLLILTGPSEAVDEVQRLLAGEAA